MLQEARKWILPRNTEWGIVLHVQVYFVRVHMPWGTCGRQRTPSESQLSASVMRALGIEFRSSGLKARILTHGNIPLASF